MNKNVEKYIKDNFTLDKMTERFSEILEIVPQPTTLNLPKLKKLDPNKQKKKKILKFQ